MPTVQAVKIANREVGWTGQVRRTDCVKYLHKGSTDLSDNYSFERLFIRKPFFRFPMSGRFACMSRGILAGVIEREIETAI